MDYERLRSTTSQEMVLQYVPKKLYVEMPNATFTVHEQLGPGIIAIEPDIATWALDKAWKVLVKRRGFCIAPDLSGTAHSFVGATLKSAFIDCDTWKQETSRENQLSSYMCFSRAEEIKRICIVQPYAPNLFRNGDLPGPDLLLKFQRGAIEQRHLETAWGKQSKKIRKPNNWHWLNEMPLYCRGCSETAAVEVYKAAKEFPNPNRGLQLLWDRVIALGMERFCKQCSKARNARAGAAGAARLRLGYNRIEYKRIQYNIIEYSTPLPLPTPRIEWNRIV